MSSGHLHVNLLTCPENRRQMCRVHKRQTEDQLLEQMFSKEIGNVLSGASIVLPLKLEFFCKYSIEPEKTINRF